MAQKVNNGPLGQDPRWDLAIELQEKRKLAAQAFREMLSVQLRLLDTYELTPKNRESARVLLNRRESAENIMDRQCRVSFGDSFFG
jgi:hypothetical protein